MHELGLCKNILEIITDEAFRKNYRKVKSVVLEIGELVAVDEHSLTLSFCLISKGTVAEESKLDIINIPGLALCESCYNQGPIKQYYDACSLCGNHDLIIVQGEELKIKSMVVE